MFSDVENEIQINRFLNEIIDLEYKLSEIQTEYTLKILDENNSKEIISQYQKELNQLTKQYEVKINKALETYYNEAEHNYTKDDLATFQKAYKEGMLLVAPVISEKARKLITDSIGFDKKFYKDVIKQLNNNSKKEVDKLIKKYANKMYELGHNRDKLILQLASDLKNLQIDVVSESGRHWHDLVAYSRMSLKYNANKTFTAVNNQIANDIGISDNERKVVVSSHLGARNEGDGYKNHYSWQGKVYYYKELGEKCGYGKIEGLLGINCRHKIYTHIDGISENPFEKYPYSENDRIYNAQQELHKIEAKIREHKEKENIDLKCGKKSSNHTKLKKDWEARADALAKKERISRNRSKEKIAT